MKTNRELTNKFFLSKEAKQKKEAEDNQKFEEKIMSKYTKDNPEPKTLKERVERELNKLA